MNNAEIPVDGGAFDLSRIRQCFIGSVQQTLNNLSHADGIMVRSELIVVVGEQTVPYMFSPDFILDIRDRVFGNEVFRDWLLNVRFVFFMNLAMLYGREMVSFVVDNLARSASLDLGADEFLDEEQLKAVDSINEVPVPVRQELLGYRAAKTALAGNTWMVVIMLTLAFIDLEHEVLTMPNPNEK
jgi:hypothetical protein